MSNKPAAKDPSKRVFIRKMAYVAPTILTLSAVASFASAASGQDPRYLGPAERR
jgi:hypothetical protein